MTGLNQMNFEQNRSMAEIIVSLDATNPLHLKNGLEAYMVVGQTTAEISDFKFLVGSKSQKSCIFASNNVDLMQHKVRKLEMLFMPHNSGTLVNITTTAEDTICFSDLSRERIRDFMLVGWFYSRKAKLLLTIVLIGENQQHPQIGVFDCDEVEDTYLVDFIDDVMVSCQG